MKLSRMLNLNFTNMKRMTMKTIGFMCLWLMATLMFVVTPTVAQEITDIRVIELPPYYPGEDITIEVDVQDLENPEDFRYRVVYDYSHYGELLFFGHLTNPNAAEPDVDITAIDVDGNGTITISNVTIPINLYNYDNRLLSVLITDATLSYEDEWEDDSEPWESDYPGTPGYFNDDLEDYNFVEYLKSANYKKK